MINASAEFLEQCQVKGKRWHRILESEREIRQNLEDMLQQFSKQHSHLESMIKKEHEEHYNPTTANTGSLVMGTEDRSKDDKEDHLTKTAEIPEATFNVVQRKHRSEISGGAASGAGSGEEASEELGSSSSHVANIKEGNDKKPSSKLKSTVIKHRGTTVPEKPNIPFSL